MIIGPAIAFLIILVSFIGIFVLHLFRLGAPLRTPVETSPQDPGLGSSDRVANYSSPGPFISMPNDLKTNDQMVAWMTKELPKLTAQIATREAKALIGSGVRGSDGVAGSSERPRGFLAWLRRA